ncbi:MAG: conjugal transfer protein TraB [Deltaproteobacteria bacterium]|nr:conjugal transfer protein TraB [Deltaproteobacteria bacterium]
MANIDEQILRATKEIVVKFIENGRISPTGFHETFESIYHTVDKTAKASIKAPQPEVKKKDKAEKNKSS